MTDDQIIAIRDAMLPSHGDGFDCIAFARAILLEADRDEIITPIPRGEVEAGAMDTATHPAAPRLR